MNGAGRIETRSQSPTNVQCWRTNLPRTPDGIPTHVVKEAQTRQGIPLKEAIQIANEHLKEHPGATIVVGRPGLNISGNY